MRPRGSWSLTNALRQELAGAGHPGQRACTSATWTPTWPGLSPRPSPTRPTIARLALDGIEAGDTEIIADEISKLALAGLSGGVAALYPQVA